uniref:Uncharacterized protein n=1 Tax=Salarias fasciatus TaxID=181472 RepID=A0A672II26_SALFA
MSVRLMSHLTLKFHNNFISTAASAGSLTYCTCNVNVMQLSFQNVRVALYSKPGGKEIFQEYEKTNAISDATRRKMANILVADMVRATGKRVPPVNVRNLYALGMTTLFPKLKDPDSKNGYVSINSNKRLLLFVFTFTPRVSAARLHSPAIARRHPSNLTGN